MIYLPEVAVGTVISLLKSAVLFLFICAYTVLPSKNYTWFSTSSYLKIM